MNYWEECIRIAFEESGITATEQQILEVAGAVEGGHQNYGMAHGYDCIPNPLRTENDQLAKELKIERSKVHCEKCNGHGRIDSYGPGTIMSNSQCWKCHGEGKYVP